MSWFDKLKQSFVPTPPADPGIAERQAEGLEDLITSQRKILSQKSISSKVFESNKVTATQSHLNPVAHNILEKARAAQVAANGDENTVPTSTADLFFLKGEAQKRVTHLQNVYLEKAKNTTSKFTTAAKTAFKPQVNPFKKDK
jgi:hypothetical protein